MLNQQVIESSLDLLTPSEMQRKGGIDRSLFCNTVNLSKGDPKTKRQEILEYFDKTYSLYEELFAVIASDEGYFYKAERLRHPLIFYYGHTATFYMNKLILAGLIPNHVNEKFEAMFAVGVDENDWDDLDETHYDWPTVKETQEYRNKVRQVVRTAIEQMPLELPIQWESPAWAILLVIEHERIHTETSAPIIRQLPVKYVQNTKIFRSCPIRNNSGYDSSGQPKINKKSFPTNELKKVEGGLVKLGKTDPHYGWDNEYGNYEESLEDFSMSKFLVSNLEYLDFVQEGGYDCEKYWTEEGWRWNRSTKAHHPLFWVPIDDFKPAKAFKYRAMTEEIDMPWDWPVEVNHLEAKAFCNWKSEKLGKTIRLPVESEYNRVRQLLYGDSNPTDWEFGAVGNINLEQWASSCPVDMNGKDGFYDIVGNVWQHSETTLFPFNGFRVHELYDDFSTPFFLGQHSMMLGGSWITTGASAFASYRLSFRRHFYQFTGIRYVESKNSVVKKSTECEFDPEITACIELHYGQQSENFFKKCADLCIEHTKTTGGSFDKALDLGCGVGRATFELAKAFKEVIGFDASSRFFQTGVRLKKEGKIRYSLLTGENKFEHKELEFESLGLEKIKQNMHFYQQDPFNIDIKKFNSFNLILISRLIDQTNQPDLLLNSIHKYMTKGGLLVIASSRYWNNDDSEKVIEKQENSEGSDSLKSLLQAHFKEAFPPVKITNTDKKIAHLAFFVKISDS